MTTAIKGRFKAFKSWLTAVWTGESQLTAAVGEYEDYLAMFGEEEEGERLSLRQFYEATRAPEALGDFDTYIKVMSRMGQVADKAHYIEVRQEGR